MCARYQDKTDLMSVIIMDDSFDLHIKLITYFIYMYVFGPSHITSGPDLEHAPRQPLLLT